MQGSPVETSGPERRQQDRRAAYVVTQQYSSATCASLLFTAWKNSERASEMLLFNFLTFK
jgi:hypothetical protein